MQTARLRPWAWAGVACGAVAMAVMHVLQVESGIRVGERRDSDGRSGRQWAAEAAGKSTEQHCRQAAYDIAKSIERNDFSGRLGEVNVLQSDMLLTDTGERFRVSLVAAGRFLGRVLTVERFGKDGRPSYVKFYAAERVVLRAEDRAGVSAAIEIARDEKMGYHIPFDYEYYPVMEVASEKSLGGIFRILKKLGAGGEGRWKVGFYDLEGRLDYLHFSGGAW